MPSSFLENLRVQGEKREIHEEGGCIVSCGALEIEEVFHNVACGESGEFGHLGDSVTAREDLGDGFAMRLTRVHRHPRGVMVTTYTSSLGGRSIGLYHGQVEGWKEKLKKANCMKKKI